MKNSYYLSIGEPWNFEGPDGQNIIRGSIVKIIGPRCLIYKANHITKFDKGSGSFLALFPRYVGTSFDDLKKGMDITINGILIEGYHDTMDEKELEKEKFVIIGSIRT